MYFVKLSIIVVIMSYNVFIIEFCDFENFVMKFIVIFLKSFFDIGSD